MLTQEADHILLPLLNGDYTLAQIAKLDETLALVYITSRRMTSQSKVVAFGSSDIKAAVVVDIETVPADHWKIVGYETIPTMRTLFGNPIYDIDDETLRHDPSVIEAFANALHGLYPWDGFPDADFFTNMLRTPNNPPSRARMSADFPKPT